MAVWLIDARGLSRLLGRFAPGSLRPTPRASTTRPAAPDTTEATPAPVPSAPAPVAYERVVAAPGAPAGPVPVGRRDRSKVPAAYTAVEGSYREVARVPLWRKLVSLILLLVVLALVAAAIAAITGATIGLVAELVDGAVG